MKYFFIINGIIAISTGIMWTFNITAIDKLTSVASIICLGSIYILYGITYKKVN